MTNPYSSTAAPPRLCRYCSKPEHGSAACNTVTTKDSEGSSAVADPGVRSQCHALGGGAPDPTLRVSKWVPTTDLMMLRRMGKLQEECGELATVAARCIIQGIDEVDPGSGKVNRARLEAEIADVYAQLDETAQRLGLDAAYIEKRRATKRGYMREWEQMFCAPEARAEETPRAERTGDHDERA